MADKVSSISSPHPERTRVFFYILSPIAAGSNCKLAEMNARTTDVKVESRKWKVPNGNCEKLQTGGESLS